MDKTILLVDDNKMILEVEKEYLQYTRTYVLTACDGHEAFTMTKAKRPDLIFMDLEMPRMDGASCCRAIKSESALACIPVVMVTSSKEEHVMDNCYSAGCDAFISKPLDRDLFLGVARRFIPNLDRRELRIPVAFKATINAKNQTIPSTLRNISSGGAYVITDYFGTPNEVIKISFSLPNGTDIECHGRIAWINRTNSAIPKGLGVKFALMSQMAKEALREFLGRK